jgi:general secretion pathway protein G|tara:strand:- start:1580 stop:2011 length:432 start_codon:yes stop_codon:yes gene_type:complete
MFMNSSKRLGFTLLEILIAIALLAAIAALLITNLDKILGGGKKEIARIFVNETLVTPLMTYRVNVGSYPSTEEGLEALMTQPSEETENWDGPYVTKLSKDPWGRPYNYKFPGIQNLEKFDLWSLGPDGVESEDDIVNWNNAKE